MRHILAPILAAAALLAQPPSRFEVVSIKPPNGLGTRMDNARVDLGSVPVFQLIKRAYGLQSFQISAPNWTETTRFDVLAKLPDGATIENVPAMMQTLLAERFGLVAHRESKELSVYALVAAKDGPKLTPTPPDFDPNARGPLKSMTFSDYAEVLSVGLDLPVVDASGISGEFAFDIVPFLNLQRYAPLREHGIGRGLAPGADLSSGMADVLRSQGLRLEHRKMPVQMLVIDHIEKTPVKN